jgi:hypothetical protein
MYGIWNGMEKRFVFGIKKPTAKEALKEFRDKAGKASYCWRYEARKIPENWKNPKNKAY